MSTAEFANFVLNEPARRGGELVDAADARKVAAIDGVCGGNARVFTHEDGRDADALCAQGAHLLRCVVDADLPVVVTAERNFAARQNFVAVVGRGVGQQDEQMPGRGTGVKADQSASPSRFQPAAK